MIRLYFGAIIGLALVALAALGVGAWISGILPKGLRRFDRAAFSLLGGLGVLSTLLFLVGQVSFTRTSILLLVMPACVAGIFVVFRALPQLSAMKLAATRLPILPLALIILVLSLTALGGLAEVTGDWKSDTVSYHLLGPKVWLRNGLIRPVADNSLTSFPQIPETLFATLWSLGGPRAPSFSCFLTLALLMAVAASLAVRVGLSNAEACWVAGLVATMPAIYSGSNFCVVDGIFAAFAIAACRIGLDARRLREWLAVGLFCGFALGTKYTGLLAAPAIVVCVALTDWQDFRTRQLPDYARRIAVAMAVALVVASPYYLRNWILLGCPIYPPPPGYEGLCSPKYLSADAIAYLHSYIRQRGAGLGRSFGAFLLLPFSLTYRTSWFHGGGGIGLCPLAFGPIGVVASRNSRSTKILVLLVLVLTALWFVTQQESRFLIHVYVISLIFAVLGWREVAGSQRRLSRYLAFAVVFLSCSFGIFMIIRAQAGNARAALFTTSATLKHKTEIPFLASFDYFNRDDSVKRVLILDGIVPPFYLDKDYVKPVGQWGERTLPGAPNSQQALEQALAHRYYVSHVLDVQSEYSQFQIDPQTPGLTLIFEAKNQRVYRLN